MKAKKIKRRKYKRNYFEDFSEFAKVIYRLMNKHNVTINGLAKSSNRTRECISGIIHGRFDMQFWFLAMCKNLFNDEFDLNYWMIYFGCYSEAVRKHYRENIEQYKKLLDKADINHGDEAMVIIDQDLELGPKKRQRKAPRKIPKKPRSGTILTYRIEES